MDKEDIKKKKYRSAVLEFFRIGSVSAVVSVLTNYLLFKFVYFFRFSSDISLFLLETYIVVFSIGLAVLGIWGYNSIKEDTKQSVEESANKLIRSEVNKVDTNLEEKLKNYVDANLEDELENYKKENDHIKKELQKLQSEISIWFNTQKASGKIK